MEIRNGFEGLKSLLGVSGAAAPAAKEKAAAASQGAFDADHATLSSAASQMAQAVGEDGVRMEKVAAVQAALANGTYSVPASAVASRIVDAMLGGW